MRSTTLPPVDRAPGRPAAARLAELRTPLVVVAGAPLAVASGWLSAQRSPVLVAGAIAGVAIGLLALRRALVAVAVMLGVIAILPFGVLPLRLGVAPTLLDLATAMVFLVWLAGVATGRVRARVSGVVVGVVAFCAALVVAYVFSPDRLALDETARGFAKLVAAHLIVLPSVGLVVRPGDVRRIVAWFVVLAVAEASIGLALYLVPRGLAYRLLASLSVVGYPTGDSVLRYRPDTEILRAIGTSIDPNMLGALLMVAGAVVGAQLAAPHPRVRRIWLAAALAPIALCLLLTESRGAWLGLAGGMLLIAGLVYRKVWVAAVIAAPAALLSPPAQRFTAHLLSGLRAQDRAASMRVGEIENALAVIARHPLFGVGWGSGGEAIDLEFTLGVSNVFLTVAERSGLPAMALYATCWLALAAALWPGLRARIRRDDPNGRSRDDGVFVGLCAALGGAAIAGMVDHHFVRFPHLVSLLWLTAALALTTARASEARDA